MIHTQTHHESLPLGGKAQRLREDGALKRHKANLILNQSRSLAEKRGNLAIFFQQGHYHHLLLFKKLHELA